MHLYLDSSGPGLFNYESVLHYRLLSGALQMEIEVANSGDLRLPFGIGFHPWIAREARSRLQFDGSGVWLRSPASLPTCHVQLDGRPELDFRTQQFSLWHFEFPFAEVAPIEMGIEDLHPCL